jgi:hypothetical protein
VLCPVLCYASAGARESRDTERVLTQLRASERRAKEKGMRVLAQLVDADSQVRQDPRAQVEVARLLRAESAAIRKWSRDLEQQPDSDEDVEYDSEFYDETVIPLATTLLRNASPETEPILLSALFDGIYNPESRLAAELISYGEGAVSSVLELSERADPLSRAGAYVLMGKLLRSHKEKGLKRAWSASSSSRVGIALRRGLQDPDTAARREAIYAVVDAGDREALPMLRVMAATDPDAGNGRTRRFVRSLAAQAVRKLEQQP